MTSVDAGANLLGVGLRVGSSGYRRARTAAAVVDATFGRVEGDAGVGDRLDLASCGLDVAVCFSRVHLLLPSGDGVRHGVHHGGGHGVRNA